MHVNCPNCGEKVTAENINIQQMTAVCGVCDTVFRFDLPEAKTKRRKAKQPTRITLRDAETLQMDFRTNFRLERNESFVSSIFGGGGLLFLALLLIGEEKVPSILPLAFLLIALALFYGVTLVALNRTHIEMDEDAIRVSRRPLPNLLMQGYEVALAGVTAIKCEETAISKKEAYDTPRYRVWAETEDGSHRTIVNDVTEDYARFIAQCLEERLYTDANPDVSRLEDDDYPLDDEDNEREVLTSAQNRLN